MQEMRAEDVFIFDVKPHATLYDYFASIPGTECWAHKRRIDTAKMISSMYIYLKLEKHGA